MYIKYFVVEAEHEDPNDSTTMDRSTKKTHGPYKSKLEAEKVQKEIMMKNIDNYYHRAWTVKQENHEIN